MSETEEFYFKWEIREKGVKLFEVSAVSHNSALHKATRFIMQERDIGLLTHDVGPYLQIRNHLTAERLA